MSRYNEPRYRHNQQPVSSSASSPTLYPDNDDDKYAPKHQTYQGQANESISRGGMGGGLENKIALLKQVSIDMGTEIQDQNRFLTMMARIIH
ncbi:hypothetical protein EV182_002830 [Spiromyces aspiralis]|uniref:Uncharacterized protein n=1 Tax=Spiromyces aspiralis TaxID=68401 RepID=A0ACC1HR85_9FUNG|nr:hypothetical protein EV182_002830 [Spiromyces aspiralis]